MSEYAEKQEPIQIISNQNKKRFAISASSFNDKKKRTTIVISKQTAVLLFRLGGYGETYDDIIDRLVRYDQSRSESKK